MGSPYFLKYVSDEYKTWEMCEKSCHSKRDNRYPILFCNPFDESGVCYYKCEEKFSEWFTEHKLQKAQKDKRKR